MLHINAPWLVCASCGTRLPFRRFKRLKSSISCVETISCLEDYVCLSSYNEMIHYMNWCGNANTKVNYTKLNPRIWGQNISHFGHRHYSSQIWIVHVQSHFIIMHQLRSLDSFQIGKIIENSFWNEIIIQTIDSGLHIWRIIRFYDLCDHQTHISLERVRYLNYLCNIHLSSRLRSVEMLARNKFVHNSYAILFKHYNVERQCCVNRMPLLT